MWNYKINKQYSEVAKEERLSPLDNQPLPDGKKLKVDVTFYDDGTHSFNQIIDIVSEKGVPLKDTVKRIVDEQLEFYVSKDEALKIKENAQIIDEYLSTLV